jgi:hypothetical protein
VKTPLIAVVFLCPSFRRLAFGRASFVMAGRIGQASAWPHPVRGSSNPVRPASQRLEPMGGGLPDFAQE